MPSPYARNAAARIVDELAGATTGTAVATFLTTAANAGLPAAIATLTGPALIPTLAALSVLAGAGFVSSRNKAAAQAELNSHLKKLADAINTIEANTASAKEDIANIIDGSAFVYARPDDQGKAELKTFIQSAIATAIERNPGLDAQWRDNIRILESDTNTTAREIARLVTEQAAQLTRIEAKVDTIDQKQDQQLANQDQQLANDAETHRRLDRLEQLLADKQPGEDPTAKPDYTPEQQQRIDEALARGSAEDKARAAILNRDHDEAARHFAKVKASHDAEAFEIATLEGDMHYYAGDFDAALEPYEDALRLRPDDPRALHNAAVAACQARLGDLTTHRRRAIKLFEQILSKWTRATYPTHWAATQVNIGHALAALPTGDRAQNLSAAIACYESALEVFTHADHPAPWATVQINLGTALAELLTGNRAQNLFRAIKSFESALTVYSREKYPIVWAMTQNNLGTACAELPTRNRSENLSRAINCYRLALEVLNCEAHSTDWAMTQNNLGISWQELPSGDRSKNLDRAIACYKSALEVFTRATHPANWASTQNNLGTAWRFVANLNVPPACDPLLRSIAALNACLSVWTPRRYPHDHQLASNNREVSIAAFIKANCGTREDALAIPPAE